MRKDVLRIGFMRVAEARTRVGYVWAGLRERPHRVLQHRQGGSRRKEELKTWRLNWMELMGGGGTGEGGMCVG